MSFHLSIYNYYQEQSDKTPIQCFIPQIPVTALAGTQPKPESRDLSRLPIRVAGTQLLSHYRCLLGPVLARSYNQELEPEIQARHSEVEHSCPTAKLIACSRNMYFKPLKLCASIAFSESLGVM